MKIYIKFNNNSQNMDDNNEEGVKKEDNLPSFSNWFQLLVALIFGCFCIFLSLLGFKAYFRTREIEDIILPIIILIGSIMVVWVSYSDVVRGYSRFKTYSRASIILFSILLVLFILVMLMVIFVLMIS